ncbi:MAG: HNH endonuclease [Bacteroidota bacterium]|uniref:HNH endonuclease n=1 Tax=Capnocytophaga stomatis TaxID=1848904 RepID=UPI0021014608|nr:HNH endonuclease [Capnocytophaga stomatis]MDO4729235.1 HNH endonuclease [Bacteroidota bacterium]
MMVSPLINSLPYYIHCFTHLKRDAKNGGAPHKPILLLSIIRLFENGLFTNNQIYILPELVAAFKSNWTKLVITNHHPVFVLPFYHLSSEKFWKLVANVGCEKWIESKSSMRSLHNLTTAVDFALIDKELTELLLQPESRDILKISILDKYFPETKTNYNTDEDDLPNVSILYDNSEEYQRKINELKNKVDENTFQEEVFIRRGLFKREIPKIYNNTCAISGLRIDAITNVSMVDACHIVPFSEGYDDTLTNGIALCPNLHRAFDRGLISISDSYQVLINKNFIESKSIYNISQFEGKQIILPTEIDFYPDINNIRKHRKRFGF